MKEPIIPVIILSINPDEEFFISLLANQPDKAPSTNQAITPIFLPFIYNFIKYSFGTLYINCKNYTTEF